MNEYLSFYEKYKISPVVQNIDDFTAHRKRRTNLYRMIGVPSILFKDKNILEIGPGGGYNTLVTYTYNPKTYTLIEPNSTGFNELKDNLKDLNKGNIYFHNCMLEDFKTERKYDVIMCEGLIPGLNNKKEFIQNIQKLLNENGIIIITSADEISVFYELIRKYMANVLSQNIENINERVAILVKAFSSHLDTLDGMSRSYSDWCLDNLVGESLLEHTFSMFDAITLFEDDFYFLGSSPDIFTNYTWYKEMATQSVNYNSPYKEQFLKKWHTLIDYRYIDNGRDSSQNLELSKLCKTFINAIKKEETNSVVNILTAIKTNLQLDVNDEILKSIEEVIDIVNSGITVDKVYKMKYFNKAFGRGQSYLSFSKVEQI